MKGKFIVFEGADKTGKTTLAHKLTNYLITQNILVHQTYEPTLSTIYGRELRYNSNLTELERTCLFIADRQHHVVEIQEKLERGINVICDRFYWSSLTYNCETSIQKQLVYDSILKIPIIPDYLIYTYRPEYYYVNYNDPRGIQLYENKAKQKKVVEKYNIWLNEIQEIPLLKLDTNTKKSECLNQILSFIKLPCLQ